MPPHSACAAEWLATSGPGSIAATSQKPASFRWLRSTRIPSSRAPAHERDARRRCRPGPVSGEDGKTNGTPCPNAFERLHTGPSERRPAPYQNSSASSPGSIASAPSRWRIAAGGPSPSRARVEIVDPPGDRGHGRRARARAAGPRRRSRRPPPRG